MYVYVYVRSVFKECPACIRQPHAKQAILCPARLTDQGRRKNNYYLISCGGPGNVHKRQLGAAEGCRQQPSPAQPNPTLADTKHMHLLASGGDGKGKRQEARAQDSTTQFCQVDGSRTRLVCLEGGGCKGHAPLQAGSAAPS